MLFNSIEFLLFFVIVYALYLTLPHKWQNRFLLAASYVFYGWWDCRFVSLLLISTVVDYYCGLKIHQSDSPKKRNLLLCVSILCNLGILGSFKYFGFFSSSVVRILALTGLHVNPLALNIILPVGISFYTFQTMSYTIDIYRKNMVPTHSFLDFALFVSFFPQLMAGPIERARRLLPQISTQRMLERVQIKEGLFLVWWGLFKKVIIADSAALIVNHVFSHYRTMSGLDVLLAVLAFGIQLYCDFSGYSDMARGLGKMMGFELMANFNIPHLASNPEDFWRRWHISLSSWMRDYVFFPLSVRSRNKTGMVLSIVTTMTILGFWHGASWTFIIWGFYYGVVQAVYLQIKPFIKKYMQPQSPGRTLYMKLIGIVCMNTILHVSLLFFRAESLRHSWGLIKQVVSGLPATAYTGLSAMTLLFYMLPLILMQFAQYRNNDLLILLKKKTTVRFIIITALFFYAVMVYFFRAETNVEEFIYFQF